MKNVIFSPDCCPCLQLCYVLQMMHDYSMNNRKKVHRSEIHETTQFNSFHEALAYADMKQGKALQNTFSLFTVTYYFQSRKGVF